MKRQFLHEGHNRQDKVWKEPGACPGSDGGLGKPSRVWEEEYRIDWCTDPPRLYLHRRYNERIDKQQQKAEISKWFSVMLHTTRFVIQGYKYKFTFGVKDFAQANGISVAESERLLPEIQKLAEGKRDIVRRRFQQAPLIFEREPSPTGEDCIQVARVKFRWKDILQPESSDTLQTAPSLGRQATL